ncbi:uncharacterized protein LOC135290489 isoform X1 [Passer domesticus]|uniref:uncharacterized protein LOC135290489 isoform X1 n=1 Tax=Passer domesticus TaxID=48849 RepID=UPI0030FEBB8B
MVQSAQRRWEEEQQRFAVERDTIHKVHLSELEFLLKEKAGEEMACQKTNVALQRTERMLKNVEAEQHGCSKMLKVQASRLDFKAKQQERLIQDLKAAAVKIKELEDNAAAARLAHIDCKYTTEIMQLRIQELETILRENQLGTRGFSGGAWNNSRESENAQERGKKGSRRQRSSSSVQWKDQVEERNKAEESSEIFVNPPASFSLQEGSIVDRSILLNLYQSMANAHVLAKQTNAPLEELPWTEFCALLHENVEALILNFHKANKRRYLI